MFRKIIKNTGIYGLAPYIPQLANIFILPIITVDLSDVDFGIMGVITAYTGLITVLSTLGLRVVLVNLFYQHENHYKIFWRQIYGFLSLWVLVYSFFMAVLIFYIVPKEAFDNRWSIVLLHIIPIFFFGPTREICMTLYQIRQNPWPIGKRTIAFGLLNVFLNLFTISYLKMGYMGWFWSTFLTTMLNQVSYWYLLNKKEGISPVFNFKWRYLKKSLKVSLPTIPHFYSGYLLDNSDKMIMDFLSVGTNSIGRYNLAYKFGNYTQSFGMAVGKAIGPIMMQQYKNNRDDIAKNIIFLVQGLFLLATSTICIWLREVFQLLIKNESLAQMYPLGIIIIMGYNYRPMYMGANQKLFYTENTKLLWRISFIAGLSNVVLNLLLIPYLGYEIAAVTTFASLMYMGYAGFFTRKFKEITPDGINFYPLFWLTSTVAISIFVYYLRDIPTLLKIIFTLISITSGLIFLKKINSHINVNEKEKNK